MSENERDSGVKVLLKCRREDGGHFEPALLRGITAQWLHFNSFITKEPRLVFHTHFQRCTLGLVPKFVNSLKARSGPGRCMMPAGSSLPWDGGKEGVSYTASTTCWDIGNDHGLFRLQVYVFPSSKNGYCFGLADII